MIIVILTELDQKIHGIYTILTAVYSNLQFTILIFWDAFASFINRPEYFIFSHFLAFMSACLKENDRSRWPFVTDLAFTPQHIFVWTLGCIPVLLRCFGFECWWQILWVLCYNQISIGEFWCHKPSRHLSPLAWFFDSFLSNCGDLFFGGFF